MPARVWLQASCNLRVYPCVFCPCVFLFVRVYFPVWIRVYYCVSVCIFGFPVCISVCISVCMCLVVFFPSVSVCILCVLSPRVHSRVYVLWHRVHFCVYPCALPCVLCNVCIFTRDCIGQPLQNSSRSVVEIHAQACMLGQEAPGKFPRH